MSPRETAIDTMQGIIQAKKPQESKFTSVDVSSGTSYDDLTEDVYTMEQCRTPPPELPLRQKLIGAWKLESYVAYPTLQSPIQRPTFP